MYDDLLPEPQPGRSEVRHIGPYRLVERIGEGGMAVVYRAEQDQHLKRTVAIKLAKFGIDTDEVLRRFNAERQTLSSLDHPNIARLFDAGVSESGRPYFVLEFVAGTSITSWCAKHAAAMDTRLQLFAQTCRAVQYAHSRGVIHRDLKPANVLVCGAIDGPTVKVIDFGIAKVIAGDVTPDMTRGLSRLGTPAYMGPEQFAGDPPDVRFDVYALGVILAELLTGQPPFEVDRAGRPLDQAHPVRPSTRFERSEPPTRELAKVILPNLRASRRMKDELDWIVLKAVDLNPQERYASAQELAQDVEHYLRDEPTLAGRPGALKRFRRFIRANRRVVYPLALCALALIAWLGHRAWMQAQRLRELDALANRALVMASTGMDDEATPLLLQSWHLAAQEAGWRSPQAMALMDAYRRGFPRQLAARRAEAEALMNSATTPQGKIVALDGFEQWMNARLPLEVASRFWSCDQRYRIECDRNGPDSMGAMLAGGDVVWWSLWSGHPQRTIEVADRLLTLGPGRLTQAGDSTVRLTRALALEQLGTHESIEQARQAMMEIYGSGPATFFHLPIAEHFRIAGQPDVSLDWYDRIARTIDSALPEHIPIGMSVALRRIELASATGDAERRAAAMSDALGLRAKLDPARSTANALLSARLHLLLNEPGAAEKVCAAAIDRAGPNTWPGDGFLLALRLTRGRAQFETGDHAAAADSIALAAHLYDPTRLAPGYNELIEIADEVSAAFEAAGKTEMAKPAAAIGAPYATRLLGLYNPVTRRLVSRSARTDAP